MNTAVLDHRRAAGGGTGRVLYTRYLLASLGLMAIASANGIVRELVYGDFLSDRTAHQVSLLPLVILFAVYVYLLGRRWPLPAWRMAVAVGLMWAAIALGFELVLGSAEGMSWSELLRDYDLARGRVGSLVLVWTAAAPSLARLALRRGPRATSATGRRLAPGRKRSPIR